MEKKIVIGLRISDRVHHAGDMQKVFTEYGCHIKTRIGLHEADGNLCAPGGIVLLETVGDKSKVNEMMDKLKGIDGVDVSSMII